MLRSLLTDRFKLMLHFETKELPVYALVSAKKGAKLQEVHDDVGTFTSGTDRLTGRMTLSVLADRLSQLLGRTVLDRTNMPGAFAIKLEWRPENGELTTETPSRPSIFTAIQEQLGLKLESTKGPVRVLIIDNAQKPSEN